VVDKIATPIDNKKIMKWIKEGVRKDGLI